MYKRKKGGKKRNSLKYNVLSLSGLPHAHLLIYMPVSSMLKNRYEKNQQIVSKFYLGKKKKELKYFFYFMFHFIFIVETCLVAFNEGN